MALLVFCLLAAPLTLASPGAASDDDSRSLPPAGEILQRFIERNKDAREKAGKILARYSYRQRSLSEKLDGEGKIKERKRELHEIFPIEGARFSRLIERNGLPLPEKAAKKEQEREERVRRERKQAREKEREGKSRKTTAKKKDTDEIEFNQEVFDRFRWQVTGRDVVDGRPVYILTFEPKSGKLPVRRRIDRALNKAAGTVWMDAADYKVARIDIHLTEKVKIWGGLLGSISNLEFRYEQRRTEEGDWVPVREDLYLRARALFKSIHRRTERRWTRHRKLVPSSPAARGAVP